MKVTIRQPDIDLDGKFVMRTMKEPNVLVNAEAVLSIDGSTDNTGVGVLRKSDGAVFYSCSFARDHSGETPVQYKVRLKREIDKILRGNRLIDTIFYEEPFIGYANATKNLMMLRTFVEELIVENEPDYDYIKHIEINNLRWKKEFLAPSKVPSGTDSQKAAVREKLVASMPYLSIVTQDEVDAIAMGFIALVKLRMGDENALESKKKVHPFQYNVQFFGADEDEIMLQDFVEFYSGPKSILSNGVMMTEINGTVNFEKHIYSSMGSDDKVLIIKFPSSTHGDVILKHKIGNLSYEYSYIYAVVWRKARK